MRLKLSNDDIFYIEQDDIKLVNIDDDIHIVGNNILYGIDENGNRLRLNPSSSTTRLEQLTTVNQVVSVNYSYDENNELIEEPVYDDVDTWQLTNLTLTSIPISMNANDTFNFDCFNLSFLLTFFIAIFISFRVFNR